MDDLDGDLVKDLVLRKAQFDQMEHLKGALRKKKIVQNEDEDESSHSEYKLVGYIQKISVFPFVGKYVDISLLPPQYQTIEYVSRSSFQQLPYSQRSNLGF